MSIINCVVTVGYEWTEDADGIIQLTKTRLNLSAKPSAYVDLADKIAEADIKSSSVSTAKLADAVADEILSGTATVGDETANDIIASVQAKDAQGNAVAKRVLVECWLADAENTGPNVATFPDGGVAVSAGVALVANADNVVGRYFTDATGLLTLTYTHSAALTQYFACVIGGKYYAGSKALTWT